MKSREQVADELARLQRDNESLQGKHRLHLELQQQEDFQMPETLQVRKDGAASSDSTFSLVSEPFGNVFCPYKLVCSDEYPPLLTLALCCIGSCCSGPLLLLPHSRLSLLASCGFLLCCVNLAVVEAEQQSR